MEKEKEASRKGRISWVKDNLMTSAGGRRGWREGGGY